MSFTRHSCYNRNVSVMLQVHYDPTEDILWLTRPGVEEEFRELGDWINIELDAEGEPLGVEILHASKLLKRVAELIAENARKAETVSD